MTKNSEADADSLIERREGGVKVLVLNRPGSLNALDTGLMRRLLDAVRSAAEDESVRCLVLTGAGTSFCPGGDTKAIKAAAKLPVAAPLDGEKPVSRSSSLEKRARWIRRSAEASRLLHEMPKPTIAMINGACAGAGLSLAAACDFRIAARSAKFRSAFVPGGLSGDYGGSWLWTGILGPAKARQLYLIDAKRDAEQALAFGLIDEICEDELLDARVMAMAAQLAALPGQAAAYAKVNLNAALHETFAQSLDRESLAMVLARNSLSSTT